MKHSLNKGLDLASFFFFYDFFVFLRSVGYVFSKVFVLGGGTSLPLLVIIVAGLTPAWLLEREGSSETGQPWLLAKLLEYIGNRT